MTYRKTEGRPKHKPAEASDAIGRHLGARVKRLRSDRGWSLKPSPVPAA